MLTASEAIRRLYGYLPPGIVKRLGPDRRKMFEALSEALQANIEQRIDWLRVETNPAQLVRFLPSWQAALDLASTRIATTGNTKQKQAQVVAGIRACSGDLSIPSLQALLGPFLDYADPSQLQIIEPDRAALKTAHTYGPTTALPAPIPNAFPPLICEWQITDDGPVSEAGAQVVVNITGQLEDLTFTLYGPGGVNQQVFFDRRELGEGAVAARSFVLYASSNKVRLDSQSIKGPTKGVWRLVCVSQGAAGTLHDASLFVEAHGRSATGAEGLGKSLFEIAVIADPVLMGPNADLETANDSLLRNKPAWLGASIVKKTAIGGISAIPDLPETLPDASLPA